MENKIYVNSYMLDDQWEAFSAVVAVYTDKDKAIADAKAFNMGQTDIYDRDDYEGCCIDTFEVNPGEEVQLGGKCVYSGVDDFLRYKKRA